MSRCKRHTKDTRSIYQTSQHDVRQVNDNMQKHWTSIYHTSQWDVKRVNTRAQRNSMSIYARWVNKLNELNVEKTC